MAMSEQPLERVQAPGIVAKPVSIDPRKSQREKNKPGKQQRGRFSQHSIEEALEEEQEVREGKSNEKQSHIDYHA